MKIEQIYTGCLAQGAYYIESDGEAAVIDPLREYSPYIKRAAESGAKIKYIFETHFHADFVSGHLDLAAKTGANIVYGPTAAPDYQVHVAEDAEIFSIGKLKIKVLHTPGHTLESSCYLLADETGMDYCIFTGDTLFIGDVGRPDLAQKSDLTQNDLAGMLYDSLHTKIIPLADELIVYPAHGAGSACGKNMSKETFDTLGHQKEVNYALKAATKQQFIEEVTTGILPPPAYFILNVQKNKQGTGGLDNVMSQGLQHFAPKDFEMLANAGEALILDTRPAQLFAKGFIPNSINIGLDGQFAPWVGALIPDLKQAILLVTEPEKEEESVLRLARVGYDNVLGYLRGGIENWQMAEKEVDSIASVSAENFVNIWKNQKTWVIDVRRVGEYEGGHVADAQNVPLDFINENMAAIPKDAPFYLHCAGGYRSMIFASILKSRGFDNFVEIAGGFGAIKKFL